MRERYFGRWLAECDVESGEEIVALARIVEAHHGDLDTAYDRDGLKTLLSLLRYTADDLHQGRPPAHGIPTDGDPCATTDAYWASVQLYQKFRTLEDERITAEQSARRSTEAELESLLRRLADVADHAPPGLELEKPWFAKVDAWEPEPDMPGEVVAEESEAHEAPEPEKSAFFPQAEPGEREDEGAYLAAVGELALDGTWADWKTEELARLREELQIPEELHALVVERYASAAGVFGVALEVETSGLMGVRAGAKAAVHARVRNLGARPLKQVVLRHAVAGQGELYTHVCRLLPPGGEDESVRTITFERPGRYVLESLVIAQDMRGNAQYFRAGLLGFHVAEASRPGLDAGYGVQQELRLEHSLASESWRTLALQLTTDEEAEDWALIRRARSGERIVVDSDGRGDATTIGAVLARATSGTMIVLRPGRYEEALELNKSVRIVAEGLVTIVSADGPCLTVTAGEATIRGVRFEREGEGEGASFVAVDIQGGDPTFELCEVVAVGGEALAVREPHAWPTFRRCTVNGRRDARLLVEFAADEEGEDEAQEDGAAAPAPAPPASPVAHAVPAPAPVQAPVAVPATRTHEAASKPVVKAPVPKMVMPPAAVPEASIVPVAPPNFTETPPGFVVIPAGTYLQGSELRGGDQKPRNVTISRPFWMKATLVTQAEWTAVMRTNPSSNRTSPEHPVTKISWHDAILFCNRLSKQEGLQPCYNSKGEFLGLECSGYRLPTEAEWEYSARAGFEEEHIDDLDAIAWYDENSGRILHPVAQKQCNAWGLYDMLGNVLEWVNDWYESAFGSDAVDPVGPPTGQQRCVRSGDYTDSSSLQSFSLRKRWSPETQMSLLGFRLARSIPAHVVVGEPAPSGKSPAGAKRPRKRSDS